MSNGNFRLSEALVPPNVRLHPDFEDEFDDTDALAYLGIERGFPADFDFAFMGVPEGDVFVDGVAGTLAPYDLSNSRIFSKEDYIEDLVSDDRLELDRDDLDVIEYDREPSRAADLEAIDSELSEERNLMLFTMDYNVPRTSWEANRSLSLNGLEDGYLLDFHGFNDLEVGESRGISGGFFHTLADLNPLLENLDGIGHHLPDPVELETGDRSFEYSIRSFDEPEYIVAGISYCRDWETLQQKVAMERFKNNDLESWQSMKDYGKKMGSRLPGGIDY